MEKIPPFKVGDRVIRIGPSDPIQPGVVRGEKYTVSRIFWCCEKYKWRVDLEEIPFIQARKWSLDSSCESCRRKDTAWLANAFRKIDDLSDHNTDSLLKELQESVFVKEPMSV